MKKPDDRLDDDKPRRLDFIAAQNEFDDYLNEVYDHIRVGEHSFFAAGILCELNWDAYKQMLKEWCLKNNIIVTVSGKPIPEFNPEVINETI